MLIGVFTRNHQSSSHHLTINDGLRCAVYGAVTCYSGWPLWSVTIAADQRPSGGRACQYNPTSDDTTPRSDAWKPASDQYHDATRAHNTQTSSTRSV